MHNSRMSLTAIPKTGRVGKYVAQAIAGRPRLFCGAYQFSGRPTHNAVLLGAMIGHGAYDLPVKVRLA
jgi:hypothetical protein